MKQADTQDHSPETAVQDGAPLIDGNGKIVCAYCGIPIGEIKHRNMSYGWVHNLEDGPDAYASCDNNPKGIEYGTDASPVADPVILAQLRELHLAMKTAVDAAGNCTSAEKTAPNWPANVRWVWIKPNGKHYFDPSVKDHELLAKGMGYKDTDDALKAGCIRIRNDANSMAFQFYKETPQNYRRVGEILDGARPENAYVDIGDNSGVPVASKGGTWVDVVRFLNQHQTTGKIAVHFVPPKFEDFFEKQAGRVPEGDERQDYEYRKTDGMETCRCPNKEELLAKKAFTGLWSDLKYDGSTKLHPALTSKTYTQPGTCPKCSGGLTRRYVGGGSGEVEMICVPCTYSPKKTSSSRMEKLIARTDPDGLKCTDCMLKKDLPMHEKVLQIADEWKTNGKDAAVNMANTVMGEMKLVRWESLAFADAVRAHVMKSAKKAANFNLQEHWELKPSPTAFDARYVCKHCGQEKSLMEKPGVLERHTQILHPEKTKTATMYECGDCENKQNHNEVCDECENCCHFSRVATETPAERKKKNREFWQDPKLQHMLEVELELLAPGSKERGNYYSLIEHKDGQRIRLGYWPVTSERMASKLIHKLYGEYNDPKRYSFYASRDIPPETEPDSKSSQYKEAADVTNIMDANDPKHEVIGTVMNVRPSKHKQGYDIVTMENPDGLTSTMMMPSGKYSAGDVIRGEKVPLEEWFRQERDKPQPGPQLVESSDQPPTEINGVPVYATMKQSAENCKECGAVLNNAEGDYCGMCAAGRVDEDRDQFKEAAGGLKWKVDSVPTGRYRSFDRRSWPSAEYKNGDPAAGIYCTDEYRPDQVKTGQHAPLTVRVTDWNRTPEERKTKGAFGWRQLKGTFATLAEAKAAAEKCIAANPSLHPETPIADNPEKTPIAVPDKTSAGNKFTQGSLQWRIAMLCERARIAYTEQDLDEVAAYLKGAQLSQDWDRLNEWVQGIIDRITESKNDIRVLKLSAEKCIAANPSLHPETPIAVNPQKTSALAPDETGLILVAAEIAAAGYQLAEELISVDRKAEHANSHAVEVEYGKGGERRRGPKFMKEYQDAQAAKDTAWEAYHVVSAKAKEFEQQNGLGVVQAWEAHTGRNWPYYKVNSGTSRKHYVKTADVGTTPENPEGPQNIAVQNGDAARPQQKAQPEGYSWEWSGNEVILGCPTGSIVLEGDDAREFTKDMSNFAESDLSEEQIEEKVDKLISAWFDSKAMAM